MEINLWNGETVSVKTVVLSGISLTENKKLTTDLVSEIKVLTFNCTGGIYMWLMMFDDRNICKNIFYPREF